MADQLIELDLISTLPNEILHRIGSALPLDEVIKTSILSSRWRSLWAPSQLNFTIFTESTSATTSAVTGSAKVLIDTFLAAYDVPETRKLCFSSHCSDKECEMTIMATKGVDKELHLQFSQPKEIQTKGFQLKFQTAPISANLSALRTLHLRSVTSLGSSFVSTVFSSCQLLETLTLEKCSGLENVEIEKNSSLRRLTIYDCTDIENVTVTAVEMNSFSYRGVLPRIELKNSSKLSEVEFDFTCESQLGEFDCEDVLSLFASIKEVQKLTISGWLLEWLCASGVIYDRLDFKFEKLKQLAWIDAFMSTSMRDSLACFLNICPILSNLVVNIDHSRIRVVPPLFHQYWHEPHLWMDYATVKANVQPLKHLKLVRILGLGGDENQFSLMDLLLEKASESIESMLLTLT